VTDVLALVTDGHATGDVHVRMTETGRQIAGVAAGTRIRRKIKKLSGRS